jgi:hypothetical protein
MHRSLSGLCLCLLVACRPGKPPQPAPLPAPEAELVAKPQRNAAARWHVVAVQVSTVLEEAQQVPGVNERVLQETLSEVVAGLAPVAKVGQPPPEVPKSEWVGVGLELAWQRLDSDHAPRGATEPASDGDLQLIVTAEVHQPQPEGPPATAQARFQGEVPLPAERIADFPLFLSDKLGQAAAIAVADALHQLWAGGLRDDEILPLLADDELPERQSAASREAGERRLAAARDRLEALTRSGRRDVAQVAAAALGRLDDARSVPVLVDALNSAHGDVVDAALQALAEMSLPTARQALQGAAEQHVDPGVRKRAKVLLQKP